jgi:hypothetical protein
MILHHSFYFLKDIYHLKHLLLIFKYVLAKEIHMIFITFNKYNI